MTIDLYFPGAPRGALMFGLVAILFFGVSQTNYGDEPPAARPDELAAIRSEPLETLAGNKLSLNDPAGTATVLIFVSSTCPIANGYVPEINRITADYKDRGVRTLLVHTERRLTRDAALKHRESYGYECDVVLDPKRRLVRVIGATITPEAAVLSADGDLLYRGRIDDRFPDIGVQRDTPRHTELRDALEAIVLGRDVPTPRTKAVGCFIE